jgi:predicted tellurium resistance membrane protein TerC
MAHLPNSLLVAGSPGAGANPDCNRGSLSHTGWFATIHALAIQPSLLWRDLILLGGGVFLIAKATTEIHATIEAGDESPGVAPAHLFALVIGQIVMLDLVFSVDSVLTAIGMSDILGVMIAAVCVAIIIMLVASGPLSRFIERHPTTKMLALAFLLMIGIALVADGLEFHIPRGYLYFAIAFSVGVETLNLLLRRRRPP